MARSPVGSLSAIHFQRDCLDWLHILSRVPLSLLVFKATLLYTAIIAIAVQPLPHQICQPATHGHSHLLNTCLFSLL